MKMFGSTGRRGQGWRRLVAGSAALCLTVLFAVLFSACGSGGSDSGSTGETTGSTSVETKSDPATGSPVTLGVVDVNEEPEFADSAKASAEYLNQEAGGLGGHEIKIVECATTPTPQEDIKCANTFAGDGVVGVVVPADYTIDAAFPVYEKAGIPVIAEQVITTQEAVNPVAIGLGPGIPGVLSTLAGYIKDKLHGETVSIVAPQQGPALEAFVNAPLEAADLKPTWSYMAAENPDFTSTFVSAEQQDPDAMLVDIDDTSQCVPAMNALANGGGTGEFQVFQIQCSDDSVFEAAGSLADGQLFYAPLDSIAGVTTPDSELFEHIMSTYSSTDSNGYAASVAAASVITLGHVMEDQKTVTPKSILAAFEHANGKKIFMGPPLECGEFEALPRVCTVSMRLFTTEGGKKKVLTGYISYPQYISIPH
ncbi:MAG TPA: ABC transporter substrate-binding protein [Solirubrobacterales bacterium]|jgi:branched-chain amino acid transport system substrate-binding protein